MHRYAEATPCPPSHLGYQSAAPYYLQGATIDPYTTYNNTLVNSQFGDDTTTANLEYTTEFQAQLRNAKPRRPRRERKPAFDPAVDIWEDGAQGDQRPQPRQGSRTSILPKDVSLRRSTILAHPAQKLPIPPPTVAEPAVPRPTRRRVSALLADREAHGVHRTKPDDQKVQEIQIQKGPEIKKDPRRRTIYVPSEDTTIMTIHPGAPTHKYRSGRAKSPDFGLDLVTLSEEEPSDLVSAIKSHKRVSRKSLAAPPKRGPLQQNSRPFQRVSFSEDIVGRGGGKENVPPGYVLDDDTCVLKKPAKIPSGDARSKAASVRAKAVPLVEMKAKQSVKISEPNTTVSRKRISSDSNTGSSPLKSLKTRTNATAASTTARTNSLRTSKFASSKLASSSPFQQGKSPPQALRHHRAEQVPSKLRVPLIVQKARESQEKYPILAEDLSRPELYEDHWLSYQEVALTQLLNTLFKTVDVNADLEQDHTDLRKNILKLYHEPAIPLLHKRLQASLLYGAFSIPKDLLGQTLRLKDDVGLRRNFLNLWLKTYDLNSLRAAAEAIVGREIPISNRLSTGSVASEGGERQFRAHKKAIEGFLDTFLIRNEDAVKIKTGVGSITSIARGNEHRNDDFGSQGWSWRRTVLRSLMLILLLDKAKASDMVPGCLFQTSSPYKSSAAVLQALGSILLPSLGDISRPLGHLNYQVTYMQYPLQEYTYHVNNIATDLRDGVLLTRLVELLLYPNTTLAAMKEDTVTVTLPSGELLTSAFNLDQKDAWVLSQHLKFPCIGRSQKVYNTQVALSALEGLKGIAGRLVQNVRAEDLVDGHREKTLGLLWGLVGKWGLGSLVNWQELEKEIQKSRQRFYEQQPADYEDLDSDNEDELAELEGLERYTFLLRTWARTISRLHGVRVANLTTSFADSKAFEAIVDEYLPFCPQASYTATIGAGTTTATLSMKLKSIGCSAAFISLFATVAGSPANLIPSRDFTITTLSFLASRLVPLALTHRAASTIQRAYRSRLARLEVTKRVTLMRIATHCATVVKTRETVVGAAVVLQRAWRRVLDARIATLVEDVVRFQCMARGWKIRGDVKPGRKGAGKKRERIRGGW